jgi:hypothetical protein
MNAAFKEIRGDSALSYAKEFAHIYQKAEKMMDALDEALTDPTDPERYTLAMRAEDVKILWDKPILATVESSDEEIESETQTAQLVIHQSKARQNSITYERTLSTLPEILEYLEGRGVKKAKIRVGPRKLEELFLRTIQCLEPLLKQLGEAQQAFKSPFTDTDTFQAHKDSVTAFLDMLLDFNSVKGRLRDTKLELLLFLYRQNPNHKVLLSLIEGEKQAISEIEFSEIKEELQNLFLPTFDDQLKGITYDE